MNIAFFTDTFCPTINGVVTGLIHLANHLVQQGHSVLIVAPKNGIFESEKWGVDSRIQVYFLPAIRGGVHPDINIGFPTPRLLAITNTFHPDIIHTMTPFIVGIHGVMLAKHLKIPIVTSHHTNFTDKQTLKSLGQFSNSIARTAQEGVAPLLRTFLNSHDWVHVPTHDTKEDITQMGVTRPISVIPVPILYTQLQDAKKIGLKKRKHLGITQALLYVGRMSGEKNVDAILQVFAQLLSSYADLKLVLIGDGKETAHLFATACSLGINESIIWVGAMPNKQIVEEGYYYLGDIFITLSEFETQGLSTLEAMACGIPVIGANARGTKEVVGDRGILVESGDTDASVEAISMLLSDTKKYQELSEKSKKYARNFALATIGDRYIELYKQVLSA